MFTPIVVPADALLAWRERFPILDSTTYLISNSLGAMPAAAADALADYARTWGSRGVRAWEEGWWEVAVETGEIVAPLLGVSAGTVVMQPNVTIASGVVRSCFDWSGRRNRIVLSALDFPTLLYLYGETRREGAEVVVVPAAADGISIDMQRLIEAIDERTALVAVSHVMFKSGYVLDAAALCERARQVGARVCLDVYQSAGVVPLEIGWWGADFAVGGCLKWLCGGPGNAFLYVRRDLHARLEPKLTGWMAAAEPFAFGPRLRRADSVWRFLTGTPDVPAHLAARPGLEIVRAIGVQAIRAKSIHQTARIVERAERLGLPVASPRDPRRRGGTVTLAPEGADAICRRLLEEAILVDHRPGAGIRIAPHFYNADEECDRAVDRIAELGALWRGAGRAAMH